MKLIIANTYYQLIMSIQMSNTIFKNNDVVLLLSDHSRNAENVAKSIKKMGIFRDCIYIRTKGEVFNPNTIQKVIDIFQIGMGKWNRFEYSIKEVENLSIDEIIYFNEGLFIDGHYSVLSRNSKELKVSFYEEGILSYGQVFPNMKRRTLIGFLRKLFRKRCVADVLCNFYCFYPQLYDGNLISVPVPVISRDSKTANELASIFKIPQDFSEYTQKYIFFTSVYDFEGGKPVGEFELVNKIADLVGKENILVKTHPRDIRTIYQDNGFNVDKNSSIPWEAIQLSGDFSDKVFLTINSGSVLSGSTMSENPVRTYYLFKLCDISGNPPCQQNAVDIEKLLNNEKMKKIFKSVRIAEKLEDIL